MAAPLNSSSLETAEEIKSADLKLAHSQRLPGILKTKGVAKVTRYGKTEYYVVSPATIKKWMQHSQSPEDTLGKLRAQYKEAQAAMQTGAHKQAFKDLAEASADDLNASVKVGRH